MNLLFFSLALGWVLVQVDELHLLCEHSAPSSHFVMTQRCVSRPSMCSVSVRLLREGQIRPCVVLINWVKTLAEFDP